ncbi:MAG: right-handed parallel beta-helix repeat-containing protein, partial [Candidatus Omnitrophica bacterium]|nr:right-handed parallel beta-helix repeat-containing protein [Candidatus Omnitrophota bacterium]
AANTIGGASESTRNLISGNGEDGVVIQNPASTGNLVAGNFIGTTLQGDDSIGNAFNGIEIDQANSNTIGGMAPGMGNLLSGNGFAGVNIFEGANTTIQGNMIGCDITGSTAIANVDSGIALQQGTSNTLIGGPNAEARNVISGNNLDGITLNTSSSGNTIVGNFIGTDGTGLLPLGNKFSGIAVFTSDNRIGGSEAGERNVIGDNGVFGIGVQLADRNIVQGNYIGIGADGSTPLGNRGTTLGGTGDGIFLEKASSNTIVDNVVSNNNSNGIHLFDNSNENVVQGNYVGTDANGALGRPNAGRGVNISRGSSNNLVGGETEGAGNVVAFSADHGVRVREGTANAILGNSIHSNDLLGIQLNNDGVTLNDPLDVDVGPNGLQNFPEIRSATTTESEVTVQGVLNSTPDTEFR